MSDAEKKLLEHIAESLNSLDAHSAAIAAARIDGFADGIRTAQIMQRDKDDGGNRP